MISCDMLVVGGGINGAGIARDAAGRGMSVVLCEKDDLASYTSSASTKLIHGGLRYLEHREFGLVRKALKEREVLLQAAPHIMWPLRFVMPHDESQRPYWMIRAGLFLYDHLAPRNLLPGSGRVDLRSHEAGRVLKGTFRRAFVYSDGWVDDARLVVLNAVDAAERGARVLTRTRCDSIRREGADWIAHLRDADGHTVRVCARSVVNAAGPWAGMFLQSVAGHPAERGLRLVKGSHIVVPRLFDHPYAYLFQHADGRIVFAIPYERDFTLIGTTDLDYRGEIDSVAISSGEIDYLCSLATLYFEKPVSPSDVVWSYSGVRPLLEDAAAAASGVTRDYRLELDTSGAPLLSVFGGKITTFRKLAEEAVDRLSVALRHRGKPWTSSACLPGGDLYGPAPSARGVLQYQDYALRFQREHPWLPAALAARYVRAYGTRAVSLLAACSRIEDLGEEVLPGLYETELGYLVRHEFAQTAHDILWRRSKLGLHLPASAEALLDAWLRDRDAGPGRAPAVRRA